MSETPSISDRRKAVLARFADEPVKGTSEVYARGEVERPSTLKKKIGAVALATGALLAVSPRARETVVNMYEGLIDADSNVSEDNKIDSTSLPENPGEMVVEVAPPPVPTSAP